jgi:hypothetical protein
MGFNRKLASIEKQQELEDIAFILKWSKRKWPEESQVLHWSVGQNHAGSSQVYLSFSRAEPKILEEMTHISKFYEFYVLRDPTNLK